MNSLAVAPSPERRPRRRSGRCARSASRRRIRRAWRATRRRPRRCPAATRAPCSGTAVSADAGRRRRLPGRGHRRPPLCRPRLGIQRRPLRPFRRDDRRGDDRGDRGRRCCSARRTATRRATPRRSSSAFRRSSACASAIPAPKPTSWRCRQRAPSPAGSKILVFREGYHGGVLTFAHGGSALNLPFPFVFADYNDIDGTEALIWAAWPATSPP